MTPQKEDLMPLGGLSTWALASDEENPVVSYFRSHTLAVEAIFDELARDAGDPTWGPSVRLLLHQLREELRGDFGKEFLVTSPWFSRGGAVEAGVVVCITLYYFVA